MTIPSRRSDGTLSEDQHLKLARFATPANGMKLVPLHSVCIERTGTRNPSERPDEWFEYVDISAVDNTAKRITKPQSLLGADAPSRARNVIRERDVLVSTTRPNLNAVALVPPELDGQICSTGFCVLRPNSGVNPDYLFHFVRSSRFVDPLANLVKGALYPAVTDGQVKGQRIPLPPLSEQERIAAELTAGMAEVDRARRAAEERLSAAEALPAAYLREVFEGPDAEGWEIVDLGDALLRIETGTSVTAESRRAKSDEIGVLKVSAVSWGRFKPEENKAVPPSYTPTPAERVKPGDFLISRCNTAELTGAVVLVRDTPPNLMLSDKTLRLVLKPNTYDPRFLEVALRTRAARRFIEGRATGTSYSMRNISQDTIRLIPLPKPPMAVQEELVSQFHRQSESANALIARCREELAAVEALPAALLRRAFGSDE